jgi:hypothetical protein
MSFSQKKPTSQKAAGEEREFYWLILLESSSLPKMQERIHSQFFTLMIANAQRHSGSTFLPSAKSLSLHCLR